MADKPDKIQRIERHVVGGVVQSVVLVEQSRTTLKRATALRQHVLEVLSDGLPSRDALVAQLVQPLNEIVDRLGQHIDDTEQRLGAVNDARRDILIAAAAAIGNLLQLVEPLNIAQRAETIAARLEAQGLAAKDEA